MNVESIHSVGTDAERVPKLPEGNNQMRILFIAAAVLAASTGVASAVCMNPYSGMATGDDCTVNRDSWNSYYGNQYTAVDKNGDGKITADEWSMANADRYTKQYSSIDTNKDGMVSADEWNTANANRDYNNVDRDQDGMISTEEWQQGYDKDFDSFDADKNGTLSDQELQGSTHKGS